MFSKCVLWSAHGAAASAICGRSSFLLFHPGQCNEVGSFFRSFGSAPIQLNLFRFSVILATIATSYKALHVLHAFMHEYIITLLAYKVTNTASNLVDHALVSLWCHNPQSAYTYQHFRLWCAGTPLDPTTHFLLTISIPWVPRSWEFLNFF